jgi:hypothetical protein
MKTQNAMMSIVRNARLVLIFIGLDFSSGKSTAALS